MDDNYAKLIVLKPRSFFDKIRITGLQLTWLINHIKSLFNSKKEHLNIYKRKTVFVTKEFWENIENVAKWQKSIGNKMYIDKDILWDDSYAIDVLHIMDRLNKNKSFFENKPYALQYSFSNVNKMHEYFTIVKNMIFGMGYIRKLENEMPLSFDELKILRKETLQYTRELAKMSNHVDYDESGKKWWEY